MIEAVVFDIDNTLTNDVSWLRVTELLGASVSKHEDIFHKFSAGELPYVEAKNQLIQLWQATGKANKAHWETMFADWPLKDDAATLVGYAIEGGTRRHSLRGRLICSRRQSLLSWIFLTGTLTLRSSGINRAT